MKHGNSGQATVEAVLLMVVFVGVAILIKTQLQSSQAAQDLVSKPWSYLAGMMETGVWVEAKKAKNYSPYSRGISYVGESQDR
jgi:hypothetical protein